MEGHLRVESLDVAGKRVLVRVDFNVPLSPAPGDGAPIIASTQRIEAALPTVRLLLAGGAQSVVLMSHLGRPNGRSNRALSLRPVAEKLREMLAPVPVNFVPGGCDSADAAAACRGAPSGTVLLLENLRFHVEEEGKGEDAAGAKVVPPPTAVAAFRAALSSLGDLFVNDAFGCVHRAHSSMVGVDLPLRASGLLMDRELAAFATVLIAPVRPLLAVLGGAKVSDKLLLIENMLETVDELIIGGGMAFTFKQVIDTTGIGASLFDAEGAALVPKLMTKAKERGVQIHLPSDWVAAESFDADAAHRVVTAAEGIPAGWLGLDHGPTTNTAFETVVARAKTVVWNGPMGVFEWEAFEGGTRKMLAAVVAATTAGATTVVGGGDTATAVLKFDGAAGVSHVSTGGGASLELLEGSILPGIAALCGTQNERRRVV